jgi:glycosyltransferase involved in cell wall biosynthesis
MMTTIEVSVVIPVLNELENLPPLAKQLTTVLEHYGRSFEIIFVDDGSQDGTFDCVKEMHQVDPRIKAVCLSRNYGQTTALVAGFDLAQGLVVVAMDGDLQFHPEDLPKLVDKLDEGYDLVNGWRDRSHDPSTRRLPSRVANALIASMSGLDMRDFGSTFKAYRRDLLRNLKLYGELHRFIPVLASAYGARICEIQVQWSPRRYGKSHYGLGRTWRVLIDMITVKFLLAYSSKPMRLFGNWGLVCIGIGFLSGLLTLFMKLPFLGGHAIMGNPLLILGVLFVLMGMQFITNGLLAEMLMRSYREGGSVKPVYTVRAVLE